jgi:HSP20 family protein
MKKTGKNKRVDQKKKNTEFDEKVKESEEAESEGQSEGVAEGVLKGAGQIIPGLGGLLKGLEKSPAFKERLRKINQEVERRLKEAPLKRTPDRTPHMESGFFSRTMVQEETPSFGKKGRRLFTSPPSHPKEPVVDVFDEKDHLRVIVELPGVVEKDIKTDLDKEILILKINSPGWKPEHKVTLPYAPQGKLKRVFRNGFLEVNVGKD